MSFDEVKMGVVTPQHCGKDLSDTIWPRGDNPVMDHDVPLYDAVRGLDLV